jgi:hypothetical protein
MNTLQRLKSWLVDKWLPGFITALSLFIFKLYLDLPADQKGSFFRFNWVYYIINTKFELWKIVLLFFIIGVIYYSGKKMSSKKSQVKREKIPKQVLAYIQDKFGSKKSIWMWEYGWNQYGEYRPANFRALCPKCIVPMTPYYNMNKALCTKCRLEGRPSDYITEDSTDIEHEVIRRINNLL